MWPCGLRSFRRRTSSPRSSERRWKVKGGWTWTINADGSTTSAAKDKSWNDTSPWSLKGDTYCRAIKGVEKCSNACLVGPFLRMNGARTQTLAGWTVNLK